MVSSNKTLEDGETKLEAMRKKLVEARETLKTLNIDLEVTKELIGLKDNGLVELEKQLAAANDQIATHEDTIRQLQEALNRKSASLAPSERECTLDDRKLSAVRSLAFSILVISKRSLVSRGVWVLVLYKILYALICTVVQYVL
jgi:chromosome segregation ATPase